MASLLCCNQKSVDIKFTEKVWVTQGAPRTYLLGVLALEGVFARLGEAAAARDGVFDLAGVFALE